MDVAVKAALVGTVGVMFAPIVADVLSAPASSVFLNVQQPIPASSAAAATASQLMMTAPPQTQAQHDDVDGTPAALASLVGSLLVGLAMGRVRDRGLRRHRTPCTARGGEAEVRSSAVAGVTEGLARQGVLPNGLRYFVLKHPIPPGRVEAHLEFHVGSVEENDDQQGMAHMLEHICFLGSPRRMSLQSTAGMTSNALTDFQHTVYHLSVDDHTLPAGLDALAEVGFAPVFEQRRVEKERNAVLSEAQMVNDCQYRMQTQIIGALHKENPIHRRFPIGMPDQIARWSVDELRAFHSAWYVPENATVHVVGDIDEDATISQIERAFGGDLRSTQTPRYVPDDAWMMDANSLFRPSMPSRPIIQHDFVAKPGTSDDTALSLRGWTSDLDISIASNELMQGMQLCWSTKSPMKAANSAENLSEWLCTRVLVEAVRVRLQTRWRSGAIPCGFHHYDSPREGVVMTTLTIMSEPMMWEQTCQDVMQEMLAVSRYALTEEEMQRALKITLSRISDVAQTQPWSLMGTLRGHDAASNSREVVEAVIASLPCGHLLTSAVTFNTGIQDASKSLTLEQVNAVATNLFSHFGGVGAAAGAIVVTAPAFVVDSRTGGKASFEPPSESQIRSAFTNVQELSEEEVRERCVSVPTYLMASKSAVEPLERSVLPGGVVKFKLPCGMRVRLSVRPGSVDAPASGTMRLTTPGGRHAEMATGNVGAFEAGLKGLASCGAGEWTGEQIQLYQQLNGVTTEFKPCADVGNIEANFLPTSDSCRAALEWIHEMVREPKLDLEGFAQAQLRMKGEANALEKSIEGKAIQILMQDMYPGDHWLWNTNINEVNLLTCGQARKALMAQLSDVSKLELDMAGTAQVSAGASMGLSHAEDATGEEDSSAVALLAEQESKAVKDMLNMLEQEVCKTLGSLPAPSVGSATPAVPSANMSWEGVERRFHIPDADERALALISCGAPGFWGSGDASWEAETSQNGFSWGDRQEQLYPIKAMELMMECMNVRLLGRVRDQLSLTYSVDATLTAYEGFAAGNVVCKVYSFPDRIGDATRAALDVLKSPARLPFTDREVEAGNKSLAYRKTNEQRETKLLVDALRQQSELDEHEDGDSILASLTTWDVQRAWGALTGLDDPFVVVATSGPPDVPSRLTPYAFVERRRRPPPARPEVDVPTMQAGGISMGFLD